MQKIFIIGNLTADPELRSTPNGKSVCTFKVASDRRFKGSDGNRVTDFFRINTWNELADNCSKYLSKGKKVSVFGELQARLYDDKNGEKRLSLDVRADEVEFLSSKTDSAQSKPTDIMDAFQDIQSEDIPF